MNNCPAGYYNDGSNNCAQCASPCKECRSSATFCLSCLNNLAYYDFSCFDVCPNQFYMAKSIVGATGETRVECKRCDSRCFTCFGASVKECISCWPGYSLNNSECVPNCTAGQFMNPTSNQCSSCESPCSSCLNATTCISCISGKAL